MQKITMEDLKKGVELVEKDVLIESISVKIPENCHVSAKTYNEKEIDKSATDIFIDINKQ